MCSLRGSLENYSCDVNFAMLALAIILPLNFQHIRLQSELGGWRIVYPTGNTADFITFLDQYLTPVGLIVLRNKIFFSST